jgi:hypothetical protein
MIRRLSAFVTILPALVLVPLACGGSDDPPPSSSEGLSGGLCAAGCKAPEICDAQLGCVECKDDEGCPKGKPRCVRGTCEVCATNADCHVPQRDAMRRQDGLVLRVRGRQRLRRHAVSALRSASQDVRRVRRQQGLREERSRVRSEQRGVRPVRHQQRLPLVGAELHAGSEMPERMFLRLELRRHRAFLQYSVGRMRGMPQRDRLQRSQAPHLQPRRVRRMRGRLGVLGHHTVLRERQMRRVPRGFELSDHRAALQDGRLLALTGVALGALFSAT